MAEPTGAALNRIIRYLEDTRYLARESAMLFCSLSTRRLKVFPLVVGLTVLVYDALLTLPNEIYFVWLSPGRKTSTATRIAYVMNRYGTIAMSIFFVAGESPYC